MRIPRAALSYRRIHNPDSCQPQPGRSFRKRAEECERMNSSSLRYG